MTFESYSSSNLWRLLFSWVPSWNEQLSLQDIHMQCAEETKPEPLTQCRGGFPLNSH
jgi:hypothetical protein